MEIRDLTVRYGGLAAVAEVSIAVEEGSFVGLIGPNGAGKTTLVDAVTGLTSATGEVWFQGERIDAVPAHRRVRKGLARTFQSLELFEELTVLENLNVAAEWSRWYSPFVDMVRPRPQAGTEAAMNHALELLDLTQYSEALPSEISLGQRKLVTVARALSAGPKMVLLDEPAAGLDSAESLELGEKLKAIVADGTTVLLIDHDMGLVLGVCDVVNVLEFGKIIATGTPSEIRADERVIHAYLGGQESGTDGDH